MSFLLKLDRYASVRDQSDITEAGGTLRVW